ncbi:MAG: signaling recognition particle receptor family protein, partial [Pseudomonadota bacterium]
MAFFKKLKDRLFKSSSKLDEGLEAIVEDGGVEDELIPDFEPESPLLDAERPAPVSDAGSVPHDTSVPPAPSADSAAPASEPLAEPKVDPTARPTPDDGQSAPVAPESPPDPTPQPARDDVHSAPVLPESPAGPAHHGEFPSLSDQQQEQPQPDRGLLGRLFGRSDTKSVLRRELDDDMLEQLEELLISADMGVDTALRVTANMAEGRMGKRLSVHEIKSLMAQEIARIMDPIAKPLPLYPKRPQVVLVVGVNGSGKTTTIGKLASQFKSAGKSVVIAAGDTFRAAAVEQLQVWGDRAGVPVLTAPEGSDPASLAFDAMTKAEVDGADLLMIDTAGRLQNRSDLMEELAKIVRVIRKKDESAPH